MEFNNAISSNKGQEKIVMQDWLKPLIERIVEAKDRYLHEMHNNRKSEDVSALKARTSSSDENVTRNNISSMEYENEICVPGTNDAEATKLGRPNTNTDVKPQTLRRCVDVTSIILSNISFYQEAANVEALLTSICTKKFSATRQFDLAVLQLVLSLSDQTGSNVLRCPLTFGGTPLLMAVRFRDVDVLRMLLQHGAGVTDNWLGFNGAIELLLFSPNQIHLGIKDIDDLEHCLRCLLTTTPLFSIKRLAEKEHSGYYALHPEWRKVIPEQTRLAWQCCDSPPAPLRHLARCCIRTVLGRTRQPNHSLWQLHLPTQLKHYIALAELDSL